MIGDYFEVFLEFKLKNILKKKKNLYLKILRLLNLIWFWYTGYRIKMELQCGKVKKYIDIYFKSIALGICIGKLNLEYRRWKRDL